MTPNHKPLTQITTLKVCARMQNNNADIIDRSATTTTNNDGTNSVRHFQEVHNMLHSIIHM